MPRARRFLVVAAALALAAAVWGLWRHRAPHPVAVADETCRACHGLPTGLGRFHDPAAIGCAACHLGNPADPTAEGAHRGMAAVPGNLDLADRTCGACHADYVARVRASLMATNRGIVAVDRWVFGEQPTPDGVTPITRLGRSDADDHLRQLCSTCHLGQPKTRPAAVAEASRGGGCAACHSAYSRPPGTPGVHPAVSAAVSDDHCFGCHSRSGRISTGYAGWHETLRTDAPPGHRRLADGRVFAPMPADVHHAAGMACIDCHTSRETMGDGRVHAHQDAAVEITCRSCHVEGRPETIGWDSLDLDARRLVLVRHGRPLPERRFLRAEKSGLAMVNVFLDADGRPVLEGKRDGRRRRLLPPVEACRRPGHDRVSCQACHSAWVPQCVGCHTGRDAAGRWQEFASDFLADAPVLGVRGAGSAARVEPFAPGMILTLDRQRRPMAPGSVAPPDAGTFHRLYAPAAPHTTARAGRACRSCHADPLAAGFGRGTLALGGADPAAWRFTPAYGPLRDGLPADAWIPFLGAAAGPSATRTDARPFTPAEQVRLLRVGTCLRCHDPEADRRLYDAFEAALAQRTPACR